MPVRPQCIGNGVVVGRHLHRGALLAVYADRAETRAEDAG